MQDNKFELIPFSPEYSSQVAEVQQHLWGPDLARNQAYLEWKYLRNPYAQPPLMVLALLEGQVVGMRGLFATAWQAGPAGTPPTVWMCPADNVVRPDQRQQGLSKKIQPLILQEASRQGFHYFIGLSGSPISRDTWIKAGWHKLGEWGLAYRRSRPARRPGRVDHLLGRLGLASRTAPPGTGLFGVFDFNADKYRSRLGPVQVETQPRPQEMAALAQALCAPDKITHVRTAQYYAWRFQNPLAHYRFLYWGERELEGFVVLQAPVAGKKPRVNIVDWAAPNPIRLSEMLKTAINLGAFEQLFVWTGSMSGPEQKAFQQNGFHFLSEEEQASSGYYRPTLLVTSTRGKEPWTLNSLNALDFSRWDLRGIFSDNF